MSNIDPNAPQTTEVETTYDPAGTATVVRRTVIKGNSAAWWIAGGVAVVAIAAVAFMVTSQPTAPSDQQIQAAAEQGRAQGQADAAQTNAAAQANTQAAIQSAQINAQGEADRAAADRAAAELAASKAAVSAADSARNASDTVPVNPPAPNQ